MADCYCLAGNARHRGSCWDAKACNRVASAQRCRLIQRYDVAAGGDAARNPLLRESQFAAPDALAAQILSQRGDGLIVEIEIGVAGVATLRAAIFPLADVADALPPWPDAHQVEGAGKLKFNGVPVFAGLAVDVVDLPRELCRIAEVWCSVRVDAAGEVNAINEAGQRPYPRNLCPLDPVWQGADYSGDRAQHVGHPQLWPWQ